MVCVKCNSHFKMHVVIDGKKKNLSTRQHCLNCVPFGKKVILPLVNCIRCGNITKFRRKLCQSCTQTIRRYLTKKAGIKLLGNKCTRCGFDKDISALEFHHKDKNKEYQISKIYNKSWKVVKKEIEKCELLCSNCHRIEHAGNRDIKFLEFVKNYKGQLNAD